MICYFEISRAQMNPFKIKLKTAKTALHQNVNSAKRMSWEKLSSLHYIECNKIIHLHYTAFEAIVKFAFHFQSFPHVEIA